MLKPTLLAACLLIGGAAWADAPAPKDTTAKTPAAKTETQAKTCLVTGSRIPRKAGDCGVAFGRSYTRDDLQRTGRLDPAQALKALDPAL